jgi:hypothetical protein
MAKKNLSAKKSPLQVDDAAEASLETGATSESAASVTPEDETPPTKAKAKAIDDSSPSSNVGISDIRKAVAFSNSVGGLDKAIAILQILKVAKEVQ